MNAWRVVVLAMGLAIPQQAQVIQTKPPADTRSIEQRVQDLERRPYGTKAEYGPRFESCEEARRYYRWSDLPCAKGHQP